MPPQTPTPNNAEIDQALKEFEAKTNEGQVAPANHIQAVITPQNTQIPKKEVDGVSFDNSTEIDSQKAIQTYKETTTPKMVKLVMKHNGGNQRQAEMILLGFVVLVVGISLGLLFLANKTTPPIKSITTPDVLPR